MALNAKFTVTDNDNKKVIDASVADLNTTAVIHSKADTNTTDITSSIIPMSALTTFKFMDIHELTDNSTLVQEPDSSGKMRWYAKGDGVLDKFMEVASNHLEAARLNNSIRNEDHGTVATGIFTAAMANAVQYMMQRHAQWLAAQQQVKQNELADIQRRTGEAQIVNIAAQTVHTNRQTIALENQMDLVDAQKDHTKAQEAQSKAQAVVLSAQATLTSKQVFLTEKQTDLTNQQYLTQIQQTELTKNQASQTIQQTTLITKQQALTEKQTGLTEKQTGLIEKQALTEAKKPELITRQTEGFKVNAQLQAAKTVTDYRAMLDSLVTDDPSIIASGIPKVTNSEISSLITKLLAASNFKNMDL